MPVDSRPVDGRRCGFWIRHGVLARRQAVRLAWWARQPMWSYLAESPRLRSRTGEDAGAVVVREVGLPWNNPINIRSRLDFGLSARWHKRGIFQGLRQGNSPKHAFQPPLLTCGGISSAHHPSRFWSVVSSSRSGQTRRCTPFMSQERGERDVRTATPNRMANRLLNRLTKNEYKFLVRSEKTSPWRTERRFTGKMVR